MKHHRRGLRRLLKDDKLVDQIASDYRDADLSSKQMRMLDYARKLTETPSLMTPADVDQLREVGFSDEDILAICEVVSYYAYVNRIADGLGVQVEPWFTE